MVHFLKNKLIIYYLQQVGRKGKERSVQRGKTNPKNGFMCTLFH